MYNTQKNKKSKSKKIKERKNKKRKVLKLRIVGHINKSRANVLELRQNVLKRRTIGLDIS